MVNFLPNPISPFKLKLQLFLLLRNQNQIKLWSQEQLELLKSAIRFFEIKLIFLWFKNRKNASFLFNPRSTPQKVHWMDIALELSKATEGIFNLKTDKQCKERWFNHLSPFLNRYSVKLFLFSKSLKFDRNIWTIQDDIKLMSLNLEFPKEWAKISRSFAGRTQHQIKNRVIGLLAKTMKLNRELIRIIVNKDQHFMFVYDTLSQLKEEMKKIKET